MSTQVVSDHVPPRDHLALADLPEHTQTPSAGFSEEPPGPDYHFEQLRLQLATVLTQGRWGQALMTVGWIHFAFFLLCQYLFRHEIRASEVFLAVWLVEFICVLVAMRKWLGKGWRFRSPLINTAFKVWITFLILSFNVGTLNTLTGWSIEWFRGVWAVLSTFVFATLSYLMSPWFLLGAVQMYFTGLAMVLKPTWSYAIYGASWCLALQVLGIVLIRKAAAKRAEVNSKAARGNPGI